MRYWNYIRSAIACSCGFVLFTIVQEIRFQSLHTMGQLSKFRSKSEWISVKDDLFNHRRSAHPPKEYLSPLDYVISNMCNTTLNNIPAPRALPKFRLLPRTRKGQLVVLVISFHPRSDFRNAIRTTWGHRTASAISIVFVLGEHSDTYWNNIVTEEHTFYGDILQVNVADIYRNLPKKVMLAFQWVLESGSDSDYLIKTDDDVYLSLPNVMKLVNAEPTLNVIVGAYNPRSPVTRNINDDWGVSREEYSPNYFPPYVSGGSYFMSVRTASGLAYKMETCRQIHIEDVLITGILAGAAGIVHQAHSGFSFWTSKKATPCEILQGRVNSVNMTPKQLYTLHNGIMNATSGSFCSS